jgi:hypothetical protein
MTYRGSYCAPASRKDEPITILRASYTRSN